jgi:hypothetical protein
MILTMHYSSATRIQLRKGRGEERIAKLADSPDQAEGEATFCLRSGLVTLKMLCFSADEISGWCGSFGISVLLP